jgi:hypothetical protein
LSQPYQGWHELCICYEGGNWTVLNREVRGSEAGADREEPFEPLAVARFKRDAGTYAYLIYSGFDPSGAVMTPPIRPGRLGKRFRDYFYGGDQFERENVMMLQMFVVVRNKLRPELLNSLVSDFDKLRGALLAELRSRNEVPDVGNRTAAANPTDATRSLATQVASGEE